MKKKLPTPQKLPSGMYRCQVMVGGKRVSVVEKNPALAQAKAVAIKAGLIEKKKSGSSMTVGEAIYRYIESKDAVLSPSTIAGYKRIRQNTMQGIMGIGLGDLRQEDIQREVNMMSRNRSPKSVCNAHGLLSAALAVYKPDMILRTTLPQKRRYEAAIPSGEDIGRIMEAARGTKMELPILLAMWLGLRVSEIRGLTWDCFKGNTLHIKQALVDGENGPVMKGTKTYSGNRKIAVPEYIMGLINAQPREDEYVLHMSGQALYYGFCHLCEEAGLPHFRFHDLRHGNASVMLALGVPDKYAMERMGHATNNMLKTVYQHTMKEKRMEVDAAVDEYFNKKLHTGFHTT